MSSHPEADAPHFSAPFAIWLQILPDEAWSIHTLWSPQLVSGYTICVQMRGPVVCQGLFSLRRRRILRQALRERANQARPEDCTVLNRVEQLGFLWEWDR